MMKSAVLNVSIDTDTTEGEKLRDAILGGDNKNGWLVVSWIDRTKYNPVELLKESEEARIKAVEEAIRLNGEGEKMAAWIREMIALVVHHGLHNGDFYHEITKNGAKIFKKLLDEAPL